MDNSEVSAGHALVVVRHGATEWSRAGRHTGLTDVPLDSYGVAQAEGLRPWLEGHTFNQVWASPLQRALQTCELAGFSEQAQIKSELVEWDYGEDEGLTTAEIRQRKPSWNIWNDGPLGGETIEQVGRRADLVVAEARQAGGDILVFAHGHVLRVIMARWLGLAPTSGERFLLDTASVAVLGWERETPALAHLNGGGSRLWSRPVS